jgi:hypothetical protein
MTTFTGSRGLVLALVTLRLLLVAMAAVAIYTGYWLLTSPLLLPLTFGLWLSAFVMVALVLAAKLPPGLTGGDHAGQRFTYRRAA